MTQRDVLALLKFKQRLYNTRLSLKAKVMVDKAIRSLETDVKETAA